MKTVTIMRNLRNIAVTVSALSALVVATPAKAQAQEPGQFNVVGVVTDSAGAALNGAMVVALALPDSVLSKFALSN